MLASAALPACGEVMNSSPRPKVRGDDGAAPARKAGTARDSEALVRILESAIYYALNFDLLLPSYDDNKRVTVDQFNTKLDNSKFVTGKRLGYDFDVDDI